MGQTNDFMSAPWQHRLHVSLCPNKRIRTELGSDPGDMHTGVKAEVTVAVVLGEDRCAAAQRPQSVYQLLHLLTHGHRPSLGMYLQVLLPSDIGHQVKMEFTFAFKTRYIQIYLNFIFISNCFCFQNN